ncbi:MAG: hypothetical protein EBW73_10025 [Betaproteobacteria bacterium]|nr:hypothetical protein [Betaproteobacteria bacterium]
MTNATREKFSSQAAPEVLAALRHIAQSQGRQFQAVLDGHVMTAFASSLEEFDSLYRDLAK